MEVNEGAYWRNTAVFYSEGESREYRNVSEDVHVLIKHEDGVEI